MLRETCVMRLDMGLGSDRRMLYCVRPPDFVFDKNICL